jgi:AbrB family looped-hinge helix DNA binding protein
MAKVTSKLQVTIPKALARQYSIEPGDEIEFRPAGTEIRVVVPGVEPRRLSVAERLRLFQDARVRQQEREQSMSIVDRRTGDRGWTRDELYVRGRAAPADPSDDSSRRDE